MPVRARGPEPGVRDLLAAHTAHKAQPLKPALRQGASEDRAAGAVVGVALRTLGGELRLRSQARSGGSGLKLRQRGRRVVLDQTHEVARQDGAQQRRRRLLCAEHLLQILSPVELLGRSHPARARYREGAVASVRTRGCSKGKAYSKGKGV